MLKPVSKADATIRRRLIALVLATVLPAVAISTLGIVHSWRAGQAASERDLLARAQALASVLDRELEAAKATLAALATSPNLERGDLAAFHRQATTTPKPDGARVILADRGGRVLLNSAFPFGATLPARTEASLVERVVETGRPHVSGVYAGRITGEFLVSVDVPAGVGGRSSYDLAMAIPTQVLARVLAEQSPSGSDHILSVVDGRGAVVARSVAMERFVGRVVPDAFTRVLAESGPSGLLHTRSIEGEPIVSAFGKLPRAPWAAFIGLKQAAIDRDLWRSLETAALGMAALLACGVVAALYQARRITRPLRALGPAALALARGDTPGPTPPGVREVSAAAEALARAGSILRHQRAQREAVERELLQLNRDLEARVEREVAAREAAQADLAQAQKMQALGQLAGGIAHDFNNVLQAVEGSAGLIRQRPDDPGAVGRLARVIEDASRRGAAVTRRLLAFARRDVLREEAVDAAGLLADLREVLAHTLGAGVAVRVEVPDGLPPLRADRGQLETVLVNLATNARDAMPRGGMLTFGAASDEVGAGAAGPSGLAPGPYVRLSVSDTGIGMDAPTLARAAEPFFTTKPVGQGTGLGLSMARGFAEQSGGTLAVDSAPGRGTIVSLWLPRAQADASVGGARRPPADAAPVGGRPRVLVVDDDPVVREVVAASLEGLGYAVVQAADGPAALERLGAGRVDLLVSDLSMLGMDGLGLVREAQRRRPGLPAILLTGYAGDSAALAVGGALSGSFSLLCKPATAAQLGDRAAALLEAAAAREGQRQG